MNLIDKILQALRQPLQAELEGITAPATEEGAQQRAITVDDIYSKLYEWGYDQTFPFYVANLYVEEAGLFALFGRDGRLFRAEVLIDGTEVRIGEMVEVQQEFSPVEQRGFVLREQPDGTIRFFLVACTAVVNRVGEIDSTQLFDNMIARAQELDFYPRLDAYHLGGVHPAFEFGEFDFLAREGVSYIASGTMEAGHPLTQAVVKQYRANPKSLGASIEYFPIAGAYEDLDVGGSTIRAFTDGINTRISILFEKDAASWFTSLATEESLRMKQRSLDEATKAKLRKLFGEDEAAMNNFLATCGDIQRAVDENGLVHREGTEQPAAQAAGAAEEPAAEEPAGASAVVEIDEATMSLIAGEVVRQLGEQQFATINGTIEKLNSAVERLTTTVGTLATSQRTTEERLAAVEQDEETKRQTWLSDLPNRGKAAGTVKVTSRPRVERAADPAAAAAGTQSAESFADVAAATLASLPQPPARR